MITILTSANKEAFIIPSKLFTTKSKKGKWELRIDSLSIDGISVASKERTYEKEEFAKIEEVSKKFFINGRSLVETLSDNNARCNNSFIVTTKENNDAIFFLKSFTDISIEIQYSIFKSGTKVSSDSILNRMSKSSKVINYNKVGNSLDDKKSSFAVLRTNPKLTGNIKLVVDSENHMFLDTFKVSNKLTSLQYRHAKVSGLGSLSTDIRNVFSSLPKGELYKIAEDNLDPHKEYVDYENQLVTTYNYGARTNSDFLYKENFSILAPLWINQILPDFFAIFRIEDSYNKESYSGKIDSNKIFNEFLKDGKLVKLFDLRRSSPVGMYLHNHYDEISEYPGSTYLQFVEQEENDSINWQGKNSWIGISVDKGIVTKKTETSYFANKILQEAEGTQERFNAFLIDGFERNNLVSANLINIEFMFDDEEAESYKMHRYIGLYLKENDFLTYQFIDKTYDNITQSEKIEKFDQNYKPIDDSFVLGENDGIINDEKYSNRLIFALSPNEGIRMKTNADLNFFLKNSVANRPYKNIGEYPIEKIEKDKEFNEFITININEALIPGEHLRILVPSYRNEDSGKINSIVFELIASNDKRLKNTGVFPYVVHNKLGVLNDKHAWYRDQIIRNYPDDSSLPYFGALEDQDIKSFPYADIAWFNSSTAISQVRIPGDVIEYPEVYRLAFYTQDSNDESKLASVKTQVERIAKAFEMFDERIKIASMNASSLGILSGFQNTWFQRISSNIFNANDKAFSVDNKISYYGNYHLTYPSHRLNYDTLRYYPNDYMFAPIDFELFGDRESTIVKFLKNENLYELSNVKIDDILKVSLYKNVDGTFSSLKNFDITTVHIDDGFKDSISSRKEHIEICNIIQSPYDVNKHLVKSSSRIWIENGYMNLYSSYPCSLSLMGMLPIKDFECYINHQSSLQVASNPRMAVNKGNIVSIGSKSKQFLESFKLYRLNSGKFENLGMSSGQNFMIIDSSIFYGSADGIISEKIEDSLVAASDLEISSVAETSEDYKFFIKSPIMSEMFFYKDHNIDNGLLWPLITPVVSNWESVGTYYDNDNTLNVKYIDSNYSKTFNKSEGFLTTCYPYVGNVQSNQYVKSDLSYYIMDSSGKFKSFKEYLLDPCTLKNSINNYLTDLVRPRYSIGYYNRYVNNLEFLINGLKFSFSFNNANYNAHLRLSEYNNYTVFLINDYNGSNNEVIINTLERTILLINHKFNFGKFENNESTLVLNSSNGTISFNSLYKFVRSPYVLNFNEAFGNGQLVKIPLLQPYEGNVDASSFFQVNWYVRPNDYLEGLSSVGYFKNDLIRDVNSKFVTLNNTDDFISNFNNTNESLSYSILNPPTQDEKYFEKEGFLIDPSIRKIQDDSKSEYERFLDSYIESFDDVNTVVFIKSENEVVQINQTEEYNPLTISVSRPKKIKYNYGYFIPKFVDMVSFDLDEDNLVKILKMDFNSCNTSFESIKSLKNFYANKVYDNFNNIELEKNYFVIPEFSIVSSNWDKGFYRLYSNQNDYKHVNGVLPGIEDTTFFGSSCIKTKAKENVVITDWNYSNCLKVVDLNVADYSTSEKNQIRYNAKEVSFNLTLALYNYFSKNEKFLENWKDFNYNDTYIKNYIKNSLQKFFKIDQKRHFEMYSSEASEFSMIKERPEDFMNYRKIDNIESKYIEDNDDIICKVVLKDWQNKSFYAAINLTNQE